MIGGRVRATEHKGFIVDNGLFLNRFGSHGALANKAVDAAFAIEPFVALSEGQGVAKAVITVGEVFPGASGRFASATGSQPLESVVRRRARYQNSLARFKEPQSEIECGASGAGCGVPNRSAQGPLCLGEANSAILHCAVRCDGAWQVARVAKGSGL